MFDLLKGVRVVDLSTIVLGPYATRMLGDFGAEIIKVEPPAGDLFRAARPGRPGGDGAGFLNANRNKQSLVLDLARPEARTALLRLVATADVFVHNMLPASADRLGIGYEAIRAARPDIVYCSARGFGGGELGNDPAYDDCIQAASGMAALNHVAGEPRFVPTILCDKVAGLHLAFAVAAGLAARARTGAGCCIDTPMYEAMVSFLMVEQLGGESFDPPRGPTGYGRLSSPHRRPYATRDGHIAVMPYTLGHWRKYFEMVGRADLADDPRVTDAEQRGANIDMLYEIIALESPVRTTAEWIVALRAAGIPCAPVNTMDDLLADPHLASVGMFRPLDHPQEGRLRSVRSPFLVRGQEESPDRPAPALGADGDRILQEIGLTPEERRALPQAGVRA